MNTLLSPDMSILDFGDYWLFNVVQNKASKPTFDTYLSKWNCHVKPCLAKDLTISNVEPYIIQNMLISILNKGYAVSTVHSVYDTLNAAFNYIRNCGLRRDNIMKEVLLPEATKYRPYICTPSEITLINQRAKNTALEIPILLASYLGLRRSQVLALMWKDVDFDNHTITVNKSVLNTKQRIFSQGKERYVRTIPIPDFVEKRLIQWKKEQAEKLCNESKELTKDTYICCTLRLLPIERTYLNKLFRKFVTENGFSPELRFHDLRWSYINNELKHQPLKKVSEMVGHSSCIYTIDYYVVSKNI